ncbi:SRPBCC family protein [Tateyamaria sp. SN3-11]|uniref:SRPBCC family protein n=1 Tax=Tateyamaria sp. SN3-11 TaxID=3092147 RepID=UPI0039EC6F92
MHYVSSAVGADPIIVEGYFPAPPSAVYRAWTEPEIVMKWFGPTPGILRSADIDLRVGGAWRFVMRDDGEQVMGFEGTYRIIDPNARLVFSWSKFTHRPAQHSEVTDISEVDITLSAKGSGTDVRIVHAAIDDVDLRTGFTGGWEHGMANLYDMLAG